jgi:hypothetical protein
MRSYLTCTTFDKLSVPRRTVKWSRGCRNFVVRRGRTTWVKIIHVVVQLQEFVVRVRVKMEEGVFKRKFESDFLSREPRWRPNFFLLRKCHISVNYFIFFSRMKGRHISVVFFRDERETYFRVFFHGWKSASGNTAHEWQSLSLHSCISREPVAWPWFNLAGDLIVHPSTVTLLCGY